MVVPSKWQVLPLFLFCEWGNWGSELLGCASPSCLAGSALSAPWTLQPSPRTDPLGYSPSTGLEPGDKWPHPSCLLSGLVPLHHLQGPSQYKCLRLWSQGFPGSTVVKNLPSKAGDTGDAGSIPGWGRSLGGGNGNPLQYSCLENPMDRGA